MGIHVVLKCDSGAQACSALCPDLPSYLEPRVINGPAIVQNIEIAINHPEDRE